MAEVFRGKSAGVEGFERLVALKRILPNIAADPDFVEMFVDEAKLAVQLQHANIAQVYDLGKAEDTYYIAMEYVPGVDLRKMWDRARGRNRLLPIAMSCHIMQKACEGLDSAHRKKDHTGQDISLVHRDVSPQNIMVSFEGEVKVIDFGIARATNKVGKTQAGVLKGKFGYMSPEQVRGRDLDNRSDIFACGAVLYELLVGDRLFLGESDFSTLEKVRNVDVIPPTRLNKNLSPHLERIVMKALAKNRDDRYRWASEMAEDLQRFIFDSKQTFGRTDLQRYMQQHFEKDQEQERERLERYSKLHADDFPSLAPRSGGQVKAGNSVDVVFTPDLDSQSLHPAEGNPGVLNTSTASLRPLDPSEEPTPSSGVTVVPIDPSGVPPSSSTLPLPPQGIDPALLAELPEISTLRSARLPRWVMPVIVSLGLLLVVAFGLMFREKLFDARKGSLSIQTIPSRAIVTINDKLASNSTPYTMDNLEPGSYLIKASAPGYDDAIRAVRLAGGENRLETLQLSRTTESGSLTIRSEPETGLHVFLNGQDTHKVTPVTLEQLAGEQLITLRRNDGSVVTRRPMNLLAGAAELLHVATDQLPSVVEVASEPTGAEVFVGGKSLGQTPLVLSELTGKSVLLLLKKDRCQTLRHRVPLREATVIPVTLKLRCRVPKSGDSGAPLRQPS